MNKMFQYSALAVFIGAGFGVAHADVVSDALSGNTFGGKMYFDATNIAENTDGKHDSNDGFGFDVKRFYFSVDHKFDDVWSVNLTTDFGYDSKSGKSTLFVKKAYVQGDFNPLFKLRAGSADMPWIPYVEHLYGFRYVENTITDRLHMTNSADWGLHALGKEGIFDYQVSIVSGAGYSHVNARTKRPDLNLRIGLHPMKGLTVAAGYYNGKRAEEYASGSKNYGPTNTQQMYNVAVGYVANGLRLGGEYFSEKNPNAIKSNLNPSFIATDVGQTDAITGKKDKATGYSLWTSYQVAKPVTVFARYDQAKLSKDIDPSLKDTYFNVGAQYAVRKGIVVSLVYKNEKLKDSQHETKNDEIGIFSQIAF